MKCAWSPATSRSSSREILRSSLVTCPAPAPSSSPIICGTAPHRMDLPSVCRPAAGSCSAISSSQSGIKYDLRDFSYIGGAGSNSTTLWLRKPLGITTIEQLRASKREIVIGALAPRTQSALIPRVLAKYESWPLKVVHGYPGFNEVLIAMERGEIDGLMTAGQISRADLVASGFLIPVIQSAPDVPGVPLISDTVKNKGGYAVLDLLLTPSQIGLPVMGPPGIPPERLETLRRSYEKMTADAGYKADAERRGIPTDRPIYGIQLQSMIADKLSALPQEVVDEYLSLIK